MRRELEPERDEDLDAAERAPGAEEDAFEESKEVARRARMRLRFELVAERMEGVLAPNPSLRLDGRLSLADERGLKELYAAARGDEDGRHMPGLTRMKKLNQALSMLRPALAAGLDPHLAHERKVYEILADQVGELRHRITQRIYVEAVGFGGGGEFEDGEAEDDDAEDEDDDEGEAKGEATALARAAKSLEILTDELALAGGKRRRRAALLKLADAARDLLEARAGQGAVAALEAALAEVLADPAAAAAEIGLEGHEELLAAIAATGDEPGDDAAAAAASILETAARARGGASS
jgi:hypothetical protein